MDAERKAQIKAKREAGWHAGLTWDKAAVDIVKDLRKQGRLTGEADYLVNHLPALLAAIDELEATVTVAESEIAELEAARDRVLALHKKQYAGPFQSTPAGPRYWCEECNVTWPCETVRTVTP